MKLQQEIRIGDTGGFGYARAVACQFGIGQTLFGNELSFNFTIEPYPRDQKDSVSLMGWEVDLYCKGDAGPVLMGRMIADKGEPARLLERHGFNLRRFFYLRSDELLHLVDKVHGGDVTFEFKSTGLLAGSQHESATGEGRLIIPQSSWLDYVNQSGLDRYELIAIRIPISSSHLHKPFSDAVAKIREAEAQYSRGDLNGAAASCRSAWNTVLSSVPKNIPRDKRLEFLLQRVSGDPRRQKFALAVMKGFNNIINEAVHLEGDVNAGTPPSDLKRDDALLCIHWYAVAIGFLSSI